MMYVKQFFILTILATWLAGCGANGLNFPSDMSKVVIGNNPVSPNDEAPLVPNESGVLVRAAIPGIPAPAASTAAPVTYSGLE